MANRTTAKLPSREEIVQHVISLEVFKGEAITKILLLEQRVEMLELPMIHATVCPKCRRLTFDKLTYHSAALCTEAIEAFSVAIEGYDGTRPEHLHRECFTCGYRITELVQAEPTEPDADEQQEGLHAD